MNGWKGDRAGNDFTARIRRDDGYSETVLSRKLDNPNSLGLTFQELWQYTFRRLIVPIRVT
jgi:hypothetical protein